MAVFIPAIIAAASTAYGAIEGNQQRQKAKGQAGAAIADAKAQQDAADAKLAQQHQAMIFQESAAGEVARRAVSRPLTRSSTLISPPGSSPAKNNLAAPYAAATAPPLPQPIQPVLGGPGKQLLGE